MEKRLACRHFPFLRGMVSCLYIEWIHPEFLRSEQTPEKNTCLSQPFVAQIGFAHMLPKENVGGAPKKRLREDLLDLCLSNVITGQRAQRLFESGEASGASGLKDLAKYQGPKAKRDIVRRAMKHNDWPKMYMANLPTLCPQTKEEIVTQVPMLLALQCISLLGCEMCESFFHCVMKD